MNFDDFGAILYLISIPLFIIGLILLVIQAIKKKKKRTSIIIIVVSVLLCVSGIVLPGLDELSEVSPNMSTSNINGETISKELAETIAKQEIVNMCCDNSYVSSVNITYGTFDISEYYSGGYEVEALGTFLPVDDYGMYKDRKKFHIRLVVNDKGETEVLLEDYSSAY